MIRNLRLLVKALFLGGLLSLIPSCSGCGSDYSKGERTGTIVKLSERGFQYKSFEGQMHLGSSGAAATGANVWAFSARDPEVIMKLQKVAKTPDKPVRLIYKEWLISPMQISTAYEIIDVQELDEPKSPVVEAIPTN